MKVFYKASDQSRLSDPKFKFYADENHPDLAGHPLASTGFIGPKENIIFGVEPSAAPAPQPEVPEVLGPPEPETPSAPLVPAESEPESTPELTPAQKAAQTRAANKAKAEAAAAKRAEAKAKKEATP